MLCMMITVVGLLSSACGIQRRPTTLLASLLQPSSSEAGLRHDDVSSSTSTNNEHAVENNDGDGLATTSSTSGTSVEEHDSPPSSIGCISNYRANISNALFNYCRQCVANSSGSHGNVQQLQPETDYGSLDIAALTARLLENARQLRHYFSRMAGQRAKHNNSRTQTAASDGFPFSPPGAAGSIVELNLNCSTSPSTYDQVVRKLRRFGAVQKIVLYFVTEYFDESYWSSRSNSSLDVTSRPPHQHHEQDVRKLLTEVGHLIHKLQCNISFRRQSCRYRKSSSGLSRKIAKTNMKGRQRCSSSFPTIEVWLTEKYGCLTNDYERQSAMLKFIKELMRYVKKLNPALVEKGATTTESRV